MSRTTVTWKEHVAVKPVSGSVAVQVTVVDPTGKLLPEAGVHTSVGGTAGLQRLFAVAVNGTVAEFEQVVIEMFCGH